MMNTMMNLAAHTPKARFTANFADNLDSPVGKLMLTVARLDQRKGF